MSSSYCAQQDDFESCNVERKNLTLSNGKFDNVKQEMTRVRINILGMCEVRWTGAGLITSDEYTVIYSGGNKHERGVGILLDEQRSKCLIGYWTISDRILLVKLKGKPFDISIIQVYAPTADKSEEERAILQ